jgi:rhomboid protease GluP
MGGMRALSQTADEQWHYERDGRCIGPLDDAALPGLIQQDVIRPDTLVCLGQGEWISANKSQLSSHFTASQRTPWGSAVFSPFAAILLLNLSVFLVMVVSGVGLLQPKANVLLNWGANFGPRTTSGEWWRLLTSTFVHVGLLHIVFNMFVFIQIGPLMQRLMGKTEFTIAYMVSGLAGSLASLIWNPYVVSAGASGAIFGLYGALLGFSIVQRGKVPSKVMSNLVGSAVLFIGFNIVYGLARTGTDMAAHAGGLIGGFVCSLGLGASMSGESRNARIIRNAAVSVVAAIVIGGVAMSLPRTIDLQVELKRFADMESRVVAKYNAAISNLGSGKMKAAEFARLVESDILPDWNSERDSMSRLKGLPQQQEHVVTILLRYMELRGDAWSEFAEGARENQKDKLRDAAKKQREAEGVLKEIGKLGKSR